MISNHSTTRLEWFKHANDRSKTDENFSADFLICFSSKVLFRRGKTKSGERRKRKLERE